MTGICGGPGFRPCVPASRIVRFTPDLAGNGQAPKVPEDGVIGYHPIVQPAKNDVGKPPTNAIEQSGPDLEVKNDEGFVIHAVPLPQLLIVGEKFLALFFLVF
jgi:hypothetical protein